MLLSLRRLVLLALIVAFAGCGRIAFISDRYDNFTAYYNTFYNAEKSYTEGVDALERTEQPVDRRVYISIFEAPGQSTNDQNFQAAIDKSADVLREHPGSKWVDDALVLIGKSYFYQRNYVGAEQKFREVIGMASPVEDEARLWLARTLIAAGAHDEAREHLLVSLNREDLSKRWEPSLRLALGELHVKREDYDAAIEELAKGLENVRDNRYEARAAFLLGQVYETVDRHDEAVEAYSRVSSAHPRYELSYAALYGAVRVQGLHVDAEAALRNLRRMERDDKNYSNRFELAYLRGRIYQSQGYADDARALYEEILYDSDEPITDVRGRLHYALGELYRDAYLDFQTASAHFDTARTALQPPTSATGGPRGADMVYAPEAIVDSQDLADMFRSFADVRSQLAEMDSLLYLGSLDDEEFAAKILEIRKQLAKEMAEQERRAARLQAERGFQNAGTSGAQRDASSANAAAAASSSAGFLFHLDPVRVQEGRMNFISRWGERPLARNWRRIEAIQDVAADADSGGIPPRDQLTDLDPSVGANPLPPIDYSNVPRDSVSRAAVRAQRAAARYELANVLFLSMDRPDSAATWYRTVIEEDADFAVAQRAFYALAEVHSSMGDSLAARRLYEQVLEDYPSSDFAERVRERLGIRTDVPSDTLALAEEEYNRAYQRWRRGSFDRALNHMVEVAASYPRMEVAPRALLAAGHIYMEWAQRDSMDVFGPLPLTVSDSTLENAGLIGISADASEAAPPSSGADAALQPDSVQTASNSASTTVPLDDAAAESAEGRNQLLAERARARGEIPPKDRGGVVPPADEAGQPPSRGRAGEIPLKADSASTRIAAEASPPGNASPGDAATAQQAPDILTPIDSQRAEARPTTNADTMNTKPTAVADTTDTQRTVVADSTNAQPTAVADSTNAQPTAVADSTNAQPTAMTANTDEQSAATDTSLGSQADTTAGVLVDAAAPALSDSAEATRDETAAVPAADSTIVAGDTTVVAAEDEVEAGLIASAEEDVDVYLKTLYAGVKKNYPQTAYANQAELLLKALNEREAELKAVADSVAAAAAADSALTLAAGDGPAADSLGSMPDSLAIGADTHAAGTDSLAIRAGTTAVVDSTALVDSTDVADSAVISDTSAAAADNTTAGQSTAYDMSTADAESVAADTSAITDADSSAAEPPSAVLVDEPAERPGAARPSEQAAATAGPKADIPTGENAIRGDGGIRMELGGYTFVIGTDTNPNVIRDLVDAYAAKGFRADVIEQQRGTKTIYRAAIGHFTSQREAGSLLQAYITQIKETVQLAPLSDFE